MPMSIDRPVSERPLGAPTTESLPYWSAAAGGKLKIQRCASCGAHTFYPRVRCPSCHGSVLEWTTVSGRGVIWSFSVVQRPVSKAFADVVPYVVALVELAEGPMMMSNIVGEGIEIGDEVEVIFERIDDERSLPLFQRLGSGWEG